MQKKKISRCYKTEKNEEKKIKKSCTNDSHHGYYSISITGIK